MNNYIDYDYYSNTFHGNVIPQEKFENFAIRASSRIRYRIFNRDISLFEKDVKNATCSVAEILYNQSLNKEKIVNITNGTVKVITSEKVGDYSRNISNPSISDLLQITSEEYINNLIEKELENYLFYTGLLYSGVPYVE